MKSNIMAGLTAVFLVSTASVVMAQPVTINFLTAEAEGSFDAAIERFEAENPDIKVNFETVPFDSMVPTIESRIGSQDSSLDLFLVDTPRVPAMARNGQLRDISDRREAVEAVASEAAQSVLEYNDTLYALRLWTSTQLMYYNKDLFDGAGLPYPSSEEMERMTYDEVIALARQVIEGSDAKYGLVLEQIDRYYQLQPLFQGNGGGTGLTGDDNLTPDVINAAWIEAGEFYASLFDEGLAPRGIAPDQMPSVFTSGETVFYVTGPWRLQDFAAAEDVNFGLAPIPYWDGGEPQTPTDSWAVAISPHAANPEAALKFAEFITLDPEGVGLVLQGIPNIPVNSEAYGPYIDWLAGENPEVGDDLKKIMTYELANTPVPRPRSIGYVAFETVLNRAFSDIRNGAAVEPTLQQAQQQLESQLRRIQ
ncbi:ABC transporter substrate-binding protein [Devosia sediminis]|nr:sugar ABC transporter substrate-binding protein [Devosia sediminis]